MSEERTRILSMVAEGTIDVDQAEQLLEALAEKETTTPTSPEGSSRVRSGSAPPTPPLPRITAMPRVRIHKTKFGEAGKRGAFGFDHVIQLAALGIKPSYIKDLKQQDPHLTFEQAIQVGSIGIDPAHFSALRDASGAELSFDEVLQLATIGVEPDYIAKVIDTLGDQLDFDQILQMAALGVSPEYLAELKKEWPVEESEAVEEEDEDESE